MPQKLFPWMNPKALREASQPNNSYGILTNTSSTTAPAAKLVGGDAEVVLALTGTLTAGATLTTDTAANILAALPNYYIGQTYTLRIINESGGAFSWTVAGGTGVTVTGTATIAQNTWREFQVTVTSNTAVALQSVGTGTNS